MSEKLGFESRPKLGTDLASQKIMVRKKVFTLSKKIIQGGRP
jgi:hypothetical protein